MSGTHVAFIRLAVAYLVLTAVIGTAMIWNPAWTGFLRVVHFHAGLMGFFLSFVMGVAYWLMPRPGGRRFPIRERIGLWAFHVGLFLRLVGDPWWRLGGGDPARYVMLLGSVGLLVGMTIFAVSIAQRARSADALIRLRETVSEPT